MEYTETIKFLVAMTIMMNPLGSLSIFLQLTKPFSHAHQRETAIQCALAITIIMIITIWIGNQILDLFGITIASFRCAGGIILLLTGFSMLQSKESPINHTPEDDIAAEKRTSLAIVPLALPIIIGPGSLSTLIIEASDFNTYKLKLWLSLLSLILATGMFLILFFGRYIAKAMGESVMKVITRIMGMIIMAIAIGMLTNGLMELMPGLKG